MRANGLYSQIKVLLHFFRQLAIFLMLSYQEGDICPQTVPLAAKLTLGYHALPFCQTIQANSAYDITGKEFRSIFYDGNLFWYF